MNHSDRGDAGDPGDHILSDYLMERMGPELYLGNPFRLTQLPITVTNREIKRRQQAVQQAVGVGLTVPTGKLAILPAPFDLDRFLDATQRLVDPMRRVAAALFWFWPIHRQAGQPDPALAALEQGNRTVARAVWTELQRTESSAGVALHNLAVMAHIAALDWESTLGTRSLAAHEYQSRAYTWEDAHRYWRLAFAAPTFWRRLEDYMRDLNDPRVSNVSIASIRQAVPTGILLIHAELMIQRTRQANRDEVTFHRQLLHHADHDQHARREAIRQALQPIRERIRILCERGTASTERNRARGAGAARKLLGQTAPLLQIVDAITADDDAARVSLHDQVAEAALDCLISYANDTEDWLSVTPVVETLAAMTLSETLRERVTGNLAAAQNNQRIGELEVMRGRFNDLCSTCIEEVEAHPENGDVIAWHFLDRILPVLTWLDSFDAASQEERDDAHDSAAEVALSCVVAFANSREQWPEVLKLLDRVRAIPVSQTVRDRIAENRQTADDRYADAVLLNSRPLNQHD